MFIKHLSKKESRSLKYKRNREYRMDHLKQILNNKSDIMLLVAVTDNKGKVALAHHRVVRKLLYHPNMQNSSKI